MAEPKETWRLLHTPAASGAINMAWDEALLQSVMQGASGPLLRLYAWDPPCLSLGYAQPVSDVNRELLAHAGWDLVRRATGGRAILHADELTYALILPKDHALTQGGVLPSYQRLSAGLIHALRWLELEVRVQPSVQLNEQQRVEPICFEIPSSYEITVGGRKLVGSAQVRRKGAVLQHGSLPLRGDISRICRVLDFPDEAARQQAMLRVRKRASTVSDLLGQPISWEQAAQALQQGFAQALGVSFQPSNPSTEEQHRSQRLLQTRYAQESWTARV